MRSSISAKYKAIALLCSVPRRMAGAIIAVLLSQSVKRKALRQ